MVCWATFTELKIIYHNYRSAVHVDVQVSNPCPVWYSFIVVLFASFGYHAGLSLLHVSLSNDQMFGHLKQVPFNWSHPVFPSKTVYMNFFCKFNACRNVGGWRLWGYCLTFSFADDTCMHIQWCQRTLVKSWN